MINIFRVVCKEAEIEGLGETMGEVDFLQKYFFYVIVRNRHVHVHVHVELAELVMFLVQSNTIDMKIAAYLNTLMCAAYLNTCESTCTYINSSLVPRLSVNPPANMMCDL